MTLKLIKIIFFIKSNSKKSSNKLTLDRIINDNVKERELGKRVD